MKRKDRWVPLRPAHLRPLTEEHIQLTMARTGEDYATAKAALEDEEKCEYWRNDLYQVSLRRCPAGYFAIDIEMIHLNIRRIDGRPIFRDWRHFQRIKNELVGPEVEAVELYPAESRLSDTSNKYHLFCFPEGYRIPFGIERGRDVLDADTPGVPRRPGFRQRKL